jgi:hypothetical protein
VYPIGTPVLLTNGSKAVVTRTDPASPRYPIVKVIVDPQGEVLTAPPLVQTAETGGVGIARVLGPDEAQGLVEPA